MVLAQGVANFRGEYCSEVGWQRCEDQAVSAKHQTVGMQNRAKTWEERTMLGEDDLLDGD